MAPLNLGGITKLLGSETVKSILIWQVMGQLFAPILAPVVAELSKEVWAGAVDGSGGKIALPLSPADLVDIAIKSHLTKEEAAGLAAESGVSPEQFALLLLSAGEPLGPEELLAAFRRGIIPQSGDPAAPSLEQGVKESRINNKWIPVLEALQWQILSVSDAVDAWVEGQLTEDQARDYLRQAGIKEAEQTILYNTRGRPPSPSELAELLRRGYIQEAGVGPDAVTFQQGIYEGASKDKWWTYYAKLAEYLPPPRTIVAMLRAGALSDADALKLLKQAGLSDPLAAAYIAEAHASKTQTTRQLTASNIATLAAEKVITEPEALAQLEKIGYTAEDAALELSLAGASVEQSQRSSALGRVRALYIGHHISEQQVVDSLAGLQVETSEAGHLLATWKLERGLNVHSLTPAELVNAAYYKVIGEDEALARLEQLGYGPRDAWIMLGNRLHGKPAIAEPAANIPPP